jgi:3-oxoacyl-[acyl-carrier protein] reductase
MSKPVAIVTGASRGIGAACAVALGKHGFRVAVHYRSEREKADAIASQIGDAMVFQADLVDGKACQDMINMVKTEMGSVDVLVNNAGICIDQVLMLAKVEDFDKLLATNLRPVFLLSKFASKQMLRQRKGRIINISSVVGYSGNAGQSMYSATKSAIIGFTKSIALELAAAGITCNTVAPGFIETEMTAGLSPDVKDTILNRVPMKRLGKPEEVAAAVAFLASDEAAYITGSTIHVNGGMFTS